jgi:4-amino-4-deoxy-L-arabinose transferase-like glycosyltransferase
MMNKIQARLEKKLQDDPVQFWLDLTAQLIVVISFALVVLLYLAQRSFWADEATLAQSITTRNLSNLTATILKHRQSAPVLYVYIVKIITLIGKNNEFFLRIYSFFAYAGSVWLVYRILKDSFKSRFAWLGTAFLSSMMIMLYFANEFKQYMGDAFTVLLVIYLYHAYVQKKMSLFKLLVLYAVLQWLSFPAIFYIGGVALYIFLESIVQKDRSRTKTTVLGSILIIASFVTQYFYWLKESSANPDLVEHWESYRFPIIPTSLGDLIDASRLFYGMALNINQYPEVENVLKIFPALITILVAIGVLSVLKTRQPVALVIILGTAVMMVASFIGMYPFHPRLCLFMYPIFAIFAVLALELAISIARPAALKTGLSIAFVLLIVLGNANSASYFQAENRLRLYEESKSLILYVDQHIQPHEIVYFHGADMNYKYLYGYDTEHIGVQVDDAVNNVFLGGIPAASGPRDSYDRFLESDAYIILSHLDPEGFQEMIEPVLETGYTELILNVAQTPLYFHTPNLSSVKTKASLEVLGTASNGQQLYGQVRIHNTGPSILNASDLPPLVLASRSVESLTVNLDRKNIAPGESIILDWSIPLENLDQDFDLQLRYDSFYWFDEIGLTPAWIQLDQVISR